MVYIVVGIAVIICIFLAGFFMKKKYYKEIDRLETWKIDITNRPVLEEMQKVKQLTMNGETEEHFERWRSIWDDIVSSQLPDMEELLFDAEESISKYRFKKAKGIQADIVGKLSGIEEQIKVLLIELHDLVNSEEQNRIDMDHLKEVYRECKKMLLAHRHLYGKMEKHLEDQLEKVSKQFIQFDEHTQSGNYLQARELVQKINGVLTKMKKDMEMIPRLFNECQQIIPSQLRELKDGHHEMIAQGYGLNHIGIEEEIERMTGELEECVKLFGEIDIEELHENVTEWKESIDYLYDSLEKEVTAKHEVKKQDREILEMLQLAKRFNRELSDELIEVQLSYHLQASYVETIGRLDKKLDQLFSRFDLIELKMHENYPTYSHLKEELLAVKEVLENIVIEQKNFDEKMQTLRKDELAAHDKVMELKKQIAETMRLIAKSNVPGIPDEYGYLLKDAGDSIQQVVDKLNETPLEIPVVQEFLEVAVLTVEKMTKKTDELFETVLLTERIIQYGNRYRSKYPNVDRDLREAEYLFRSFEYKEALNKAVTAIEKVEPGALKRIEDQIEEFVEV